MPHLLSREDSSISYYISLSTPNHDLWCNILHTDEEIGAFTSCDSVGPIIKCIYDVII
jgi:hypothetical protein